MYLIYRKFREPKAEIFDASANNWLGRMAAMRNGLVHFWIPPECCDHGTIRTCGAWWIYAKTEERARDLAAKLESKTYPPAETQGEANGTVEGS